MCTVHTCVASTVCAAALAVPDMLCVRGDVTYEVRNEKKKIEGKQMSVNEQGFRRYKNFVTSHRYQLLSKKCN